MVLTSHVLADVELLCERVAIVQRGPVVAYGAIADLLRRDVRTVELDLDGVSAELRAKLTGRAKVLRDLDRRMGLLLEGEADLPGLLKLALEHGAQVMSVVPHRETLEDLFVRKALEFPAGAHD